jgi:hypothetical protein
MSSNGYMKLTGDARLSQLRLFASVECNDLFWALDMRRIM